MGQKLYLGGSPDVAATYRVYLFFMDAWSMRCFFLASKREAKERYATEPFMVLGRKKGIATRAFTRAAVLAPVVDTLTVNVRSQGILVVDRVLTVSAQ